MCEVELCLLVVHDHVAKRVSDTTKEFVAILWISKCSQSLECIENSCFLWISADGLVESGCNGPLVP